MQDNTTTGIFKEDLGSHGFLELSGFRLELMILKLERLSLGGISILINTTVSSDVTFRRDFKHKNHSIYDYFDRVIYL